MTNGRIATVPQFVKTLSGEKTKAKIVLANMLLLAWQAITRKKKEDNSGYPWYQPCTQSVRIRTFFGVMKKKFGWMMDLSDFNEAKMVGPFLEKLYSTRYEKLKSKGYALKDKKR